MAGDCIREVLRGVAVIMLLPVRIVAQTLAELVAFLACFLVGTLSSDAIPQPRLLRAVVRAVVPPACRVVLWSVGMWHVRVRGTRAHTQLVVSNHVSILDGFVLTAVLGAPAFVAREEGLSRLPIYSTILSAMQLVFVNRRSASSRSSAARALVERLTSPAPWPPLVVFPEGTTNGGSRTLLPFRTGAFRAPVPCQPVVLTYPETAFPEAEGLLAELKLIARLMLMLRTPCTVDLLPPHVPTPEECAEPSKYAEAVRAQMMQELGSAPRAAR